MGANFFYIVISALALSVLVACSSPEEKARDYNNDVVQAVSDASLALERYEQSLVNIQGVQESYDEAKSHLVTDRKQLEELGTFKDDTLLIHPALRVISTYEKLLANEYNTLRVFHLLAPTDITFQVTDSCKVLRMFVQNETTFTQQDFENAQQSFADRYHLELTEQ